MMKAEKLVNDYLLSDKKKLPQRELIPKAFQRSKALKSTLEASLDKFYREMN